MGREIRRVIPNYEHPRYTEYNVPFSSRNRVGHFRPVFDMPYLKALNEWLEEHRKWEAGENPNRAQNPEHRYYAQYNGNPPDVDYYRPDWKEEEATWYCVYETVSEGTPITPPFATKKELVDYLVNVGDFWDGKWSRKSAERFVESEWAPSFVVTDGKLIQGKDL